MAGCAARIRSKQMEIPVHIPCGVHKCPGGRGWCLVLGSEGRRRLRRLAFLWAVSRPCFNKRQITGINSVLQCAGEIAGGGDGSKGSAKHGWMDGWMDGWIVHKGLTDKERESGRGGGGGEGEDGGRGACREVKHTELCRSHAQWQWHCGLHSAAISSQ